MDFGYSQDDDALRKEVQEFIRARITPTILDELQAAKRTRNVGEHAKAFLAEAHERGYFAVNWPKEYGGLERSHISHFIVEEEFLRAADLRISSGGTGAPAILAAGTQEQKDFFIPGVMSREVIFAQGYSEPHCGTDLAGIRCRAARVGENYVINGQKIYTTHAQIATHIYLMVRTDATSKRHRGLSILLVPMDTPGITVRPLWTIQNEPEAPPGTTYGESRTNEVFFQDVEVPVSCLLGEEGQGWDIATKGLNLDRVGAWRYLISVMRTEDIVNWLNADDLGKTKKTDPVVRDKVAELWVESQVSRLMTMRSISITERDGVFAYEGSAEKVWASEHGVRATEAIAQILGPHAQLLSSSPDAIENGVYAHNLLGAFQSTVNHGSANVMRDQVARRGFGMPRPSSIKKGP